MLGLLFGSGFASLVYQVLWMRELGLLFGSSAYAAAGTLAVFFGGLAIGGAIWSRRAPRSPWPLAEYGLLEVGVGLSGVLYFGLMSLYAITYSPMHALLGENQALLLSAKLMLSAGVLLPPAILMGGTLPLMAQYMVSAEDTLGRAGTLLYGVNTLGAASGALAAGFWLPAWLGFRNTYIIAVIASLVIGAIAWVLGKQLQSKNKTNSSVTNATPSSENKTADNIISLATPKLIAAALGSGALALALEVLWTRMFQQVLQNSVYTFSIILVIFLAALSVGAFVARWVARLKINPWSALAILLTLAAAGTLATPFLFYEVTDGMRYLGAGEQWSVYLMSVFSGALLVLFLPGITVGSVFPYLLRVAERSGEAGLVVGRLAAINTAGAIAGSLLAGFVLLNALGLWTSLLVVALLYFFLAAWIASEHTIKTALIPAAGLLLAITIANPSDLPGVRLKPETERLLASWEGPDGFVAVIERNGGRRIKINNFYALGSTGAVEHEQNQTLIPMMAHPSPNNLFYLGMGTGITAGAAMRLPTENVTVTELVPEVITAASEFFNEYAFGLFADPRARILARDGRNELRGRRENYDAIIADLFIPWRAGVGNLYSRDHYQTALSRLRPGGVYVQWIPLYQVTDVEFWTIVRTFLDVFPQVQVWRGDFYVEKPILALAGSVDAAPLNPASIIRNGQHISGGNNIDPASFLAVTLPFYAGNLGESRELLPPGPIHTDNNPVIDYQAPISHRNARAGRVEWFTGLKLTEFYRRLLAATPPDSDPYLSRLDPAARRFVNAGLSYHTSAVLDRLGRRDEARQHLRDFFAQLPIRIEFKTSGESSSVVEETK
ncbi:MAG: fused MFS/spermidine synthase [Gammaproteobacteria bacterium]|nr:fused MFS/spermidine synthase [Gammaproteobacteria bacterium]